MTWQLRVIQVARRAPSLTAIVVMAVIGCIIAVYLTAVHAAAVPLICSTTGLVDCATVLKSAYAEIPGTHLPITLPGLLWFGVSGGLAIASATWLWKNAAEPQWLRQALAAWGGSGLLTVLYLVYVEIVQLHHLCLWCTVVHFLIFATFLLALHRLSEPVVMQVQPQTRPGRTQPSLAPKSERQDASRKQATSTSKRRERAERMRA